MEVFQIISKIILGFLGFIKQFLFSVGPDWAASIGSLGTLYFTIKGQRQREKKEEPEKQQVQQ